MNEMVHVTKPQGLIGRTIRKALMLMPGKRGFCVFYVNKRRLANWNFYKLDPKQAMTIAIAMNSQSMNILMAMDKKAKEDQTCGHSKSRKKASTRRN